ncbi:MAG: non-ribosomal peptide synthase/polyketide synthase, partial [Acidobacteriota bacterium]|nr:non-ribosomal peptide synthase/polyketide synthase [Acidobacteriota bacterium]
MIGGAGLAQGYLNRPALTADRFRPDPFSGKPGSRHYATGDRARFRADGQLDFLGRLDHQIKLRGFRIEPGEIAAVLGAQPGVDQATVIARRDVLVGFVTAEKEGKPDPTELRDRVADQLPKHMVPNHIVVLEQMPLSPAGKIDRAALQAVELPADEGADQALGTETEQLLAVIWSELLGGVKPGAGSNFFDLGGHSLVATRLLSRIRESFGVELSVQAVFEAPALRAMAARIDAATDSEKARRPPLVPQERGDTVPLSFAQRRLWFFSQWEEGKGATYNIPTALRLEGPFDITALATALDALAARHEPLRTTFREIDGMPGQVIGDRLKVPVILVDLSGHDELQVQNLAGIEMNRGFNLETGPLFRATLLRLDTLDQVLVLNMHHIISDGWSMNLLVRDLTRLYAAALNRQDMETCLPPLPVQYADYTLWQHTWLDDAATQRQLDYWKQQLAGLPDLLELPTDNPRPHIQTFNGDRVGFTIANLDELSKLGVDQGATLFMVLQAALAVVLQRYSRMDDIALGAPFANRGSAEIEQLIGFFVNTLVFRCDLSGETDFNQLLARIRRTTLEALAHQDVPFESVVDAVQPQRSTSHTPLFQVMLDLENQPEHEAAPLTGVRLSGIEATHLVARFDMTFSIRRHGDHLAGLLEYNTDLFSRETAERYAGHLVNLLEAMPAMTDRPVADLPMMSASETHRVMVEWNKTRPNLPGPPTIQYLVADAARRHPDHPALAEGSDVRTYRDLNRMSLHVATRLQELGVGLESNVVICMNRCMAMPAAVAGAIASGAAYIPVDPTWPPERLAFMIADSRASVIICDPTTVDNLPPHQSATLVLEPDGRFESTPDPQLPQAHPLNPVYQIYTSGSTGKPKGILMTHEGAANMIAWQSTSLPGQHRVLNFTSLSFDVSLQELVAGWATGCTLVMIDAQTRVDAPAMLRLMEREKVTRVFMPFVAVQNMAEAAAELNLVPSSLQQIVSAGEQLRVTPAVISLMDALPGATLHNHYGPGEAHMTTFYDMAGDARDWPPLPPIGITPGHTIVYLLDNRLNPVPQGVPGELFAAGPGLARGYGNRPALTAERFLPDPFTDQPGTRMYKSGDLVRYRADGNMLFLGRIDFQVKVRGYRVELGEVEAAINNMDDVHQVIVDVRPDPSGNKQLVAYVIMDDVPERQRVLRGRLEATLPAYMVPSVFIFLEKFPLTPSGKMDRKALAKIEVAHDHFAQEFVDPATPMEQMIAEIYAEVLELDKVSAAASFFDLGGHSLMAGRVTTRIRERLGRDVSLRDLFSSPTVHGLARKLETDPAEQFDAPRIIPQSKDEPIQLSYAQQRMWFVDQLTGPSNAYNLTQALRVFGPVAAEALDQAVLELAHRHEVVRTVFPAENGTPRPELLPPQALTLTVIDLQSRVDQEAALRDLVQAEAARPFDLASGPLLRTYLIRLAPARGALLITQHHIITDGWSMGIFTRELMTAYQRLLLGGDTPSPLPVQYSDFAAWQRRWLQSEEMQHQLNWWRNQLADLPTLRLPRDLEPTVPTWQGRMVFRMLETSIRSRVEALARETGATPFMVLLAGFQLLLARLSGQSDVVLGSPVAGRRFTEQEGLLGCFLNNLVLRTNVGADSDEDGNVTARPTFRELIGRARNTALDAFTHQDLPFDRLVEELQPERDLDRNPLFDVMFNLINVPGGETEEQTAFRLEGMETGEPDAKLLLNLYIDETPEGLRVRLVYRRARISPTRAETMLTQYLHLLAELTIAPDTPVEKVSLIDPASAEVLPDPTQPIEKPFYTLIPELFAQQLKANPQAPALRFQGETWTRAQLAQRAAALMATLKRKGMQSGDVVAVHGGRSAELVVSMLAILSSGGVLLNLDPRQPLERRDLLLRETETRFLIALTPFEGETQLHIIQALDELEDATEEYAPAEIGQDDAAYIFFTSGTTGTPKAMLGRHAGLAHFIHWQAERFDLGENERAGQLANPTFDAVLRDVFLPLVKGALLCVPPDDDILLDPPALINWLAGEEITLLNVVPSLVNAWLSGAPHLGSLPALRHIFLAGEPLTDRLIQNWRSRFGALTTLVNLYGTSETTLAKTCHVVAGDPRHGNQPGGFAIPGAQVLVLNSDMRPCGIGESGEIYIRTPFRTLGYLNNDAENLRFVPNPFHDDPEDLLYRTGDKGRFMPDGNLEVLGRLDFQVKVRGIRTEPGETEAVLTNDPAVDEAVVLALRNKVGEYRLAAFIKGDDVNIPGLQERLERRLPANQVPGSMTVVTAFPLTPNGKVDRRKLAEMEADTAAVERDTYAAPRTPTEEVLATIWAEVLNLERVGINDHFFRIGGHSLSAVQVCARVRETLDRELPVRSAFEAPTIAQLAARLDHQLLAESGMALPPLVPAQPSGEYLPVSFPQQRLWFIDRMEDQPGSAYNMTAALRFRGNLDYDALDAAVRKLAERQQALRTVFVEVNGAPMVRLLPEDALGLTLGDTVEEILIPETVTRESEHAFDLNRGPLLRLTLFPIGDDDHLLVLVMHHIISDAWSQGVMVEELTLLYANPNAELPKPAIQYADYAAWQQSWLTGEERERRLSWWREQLADAPPLLTLPTDRPRPNVQTFNGDLVRFTIPAATNAELLRMERSLGVTRFMTLQAAFVALLSKLSGMSDICIGTGVANRTHLEVERLIGFFVNTLVLRNDLSGNPSFTDLLQRVRKTTLDAYAHQETPFDLVVEAVRPDRDLSRGPLFQVMLVLENAPAGEARLTDLTIEPVPATRTSSRYDLTLFVTESPEDLICAVEYNTDLFDGSTIRTLGNHYNHILETWTAQPNLPFAEIDLMDRATRKAVLESWNQTGSDYPSQASIPEILEEMVARFPDAPAIITGDESVTYRQLGERVDLLAGRLANFGVGPGTPVGLLMPAGLPMITAMAAVLQLGGAYVPLDLNNPTERQGGIVAETNMPVVVTDAADVAFPGVVIVDPIEERASNRVDGHRRPSSADHIAYIMYTSGSTGKPKGTLIPHRAVIRLVRQTDYVRLEPGVRVANIATPAFDAATLEIWGPLLNGGTAVIAPKDVVLDTPRFCAWLADHDIDVMFITTALFNRHAAENPDTFMSVGTLLVGGEALDSNSIDRVLQGNAPERLLNAYGPTENTTFSTWYRLIQPGADLPIGGPVANSTVYVLDRHARPVTEGTPGELYLGGDGLSTGYLKRPGLTATRFVPNSFAGKGARLYRSGDLVSWRFEAGKPVLHFIGRIDHQVKLRGFRIELGEIRTVLESLPNVMQAYVQMRDQMLVAYLRTEAETPEEDLRNALRAQLPEYMVPSAFVFLEAFPLTPNGKLDLRALPAPERSGDDVTAPRNAAEETLVDIFREILDARHIGIHDNFFDLGGHSLLATRAVSRIREQLGIEVPLKHFWSAPTVAGLAALLETGAKAAPPLKPRQADAPVPLSFAQERLWFLDRLNAGKDRIAAASYNVPTALRLKGLLDVRALSRALAAVIARHEALRTSFAVTDEQPVQVIHPGAGESLPVIDLCGAGENDLQQLAAADALRIFDLEKGPLFRANMIRLSPTDHALLLNQHHIIADGWSLGVLVAELTAHYQSLALHDHLADLPPLPLQYGDYAAWQRSWLQGRVLDQMMNWWADHLSGAPSLLELPADRPRPAVQTFAGDITPVYVDADQTRAVETLSRETGATVFTVLNTAFSVLLGLYADQQDVVVGTPVAGRDRSEIENLMGFFVNTLALRTTWDESCDFRTLLRRITPGVIEAFSRAQIPLELIIETLQPERDLSHTPLFQVMFVHQNLPETHAELPGLILEGVPVPRTVAKFDLTLNLTPHPEGLSGHLEYNTDLFNADTARRLTGHFKVLLQRLTADPAAPLADISLLETEERLQLLETWNATAAPMPSNVLDRLQHGDRDALVFAGNETESLTYTQLLDQAASLAGYLKQQGAQEGELIGLCAAPGPERITAIQGIMWAGCAYLPLDPEYPQERLDYMVRDAGLRRVFSSQPMAEVQTLDLNSRGEAVPAATVHDQQPAYVIYTSGSTGKPKGTVLTHAGLANLAQAQIDVFAIDAHSRLLQFASFGFDASVSEIFTTLCAGGTLYLASRDKTMPGHPLADFLVEHHISHITLPPSALAVMPRVELPDLTTLIVAGETCPPELADAWSKNRRFIDAYGPTETTVCATAAVNPATDTRLSIGTPIANTCVYVLDRRGRPNPIGIPGQLVIGGTGLAQGYLHKPALTADRFRPDPFSGETGMRLYLSGDRARFRADGSLDFLGRLDHQVKLRGFRIEPDEIAAVLAAQAGVQQAAVVVRIRPQAMLAAFITATEVNTADLKDRLAKELPAHMVPSAIVVLDALPLTPNGKIDRQNLITRDLPLQEGELTPLRTNTQQLLAAIWSDLLDGAEIGANSSFFDLGGHSLLATRLVSRIRENFGIELPVPAVFEAPNLAALAERIDAGDQVDRPPLTPQPRTDNIPLSLAQRRLWFFSQWEEGRGATYNIPTAMRLEGAFDAQALQQALNALARRHEPLRTIFADHAGEPVQVIASEAHVSLIFIDLGDLDEPVARRHMATLAAAEVNRGFNLQTGPLFRAILVRTEPDHHALVLNMHHIISDGWSMNVLVRDLTQLYAVAIQHSEAALPELPVQYADYALWQQSFADSIEQQIQWWQNNLAGLPDLLELPTDNPRPAVQTFNGNRIPFLVDGETLNRLVQEGNAQGATLFMILQAALLIVLQRYSRGDDIALGAPYANRGAAEIEQLIGFFVNTLVFRGDLSGEPTFADLLTRVRRNALEVLAHQDVPFESIVDAVHPQRSTSHSPLFQVMLDLENQPEHGATPLPGVTLSPLGATHMVARFDLTFSFRRAGEGLAGVLEYNTDLFHEETAHRFTRHLGNLLRTLPSRFQTAISDLSLMDRDEMKRLLETWNRTPQADPFPNTVQDLVETMAQRQPEAPAVVFEDQSWTYRQLWSVSLDIAQRLTALGAGPETTVVVCISRCQALPAAVAGVLAAGAAYVPLDPTWPKERLAFMLADSGAVAVLCDAASAAGLPKHEAPNLVMAADGSFADDLPMRVTLRHADPQHPAYAIYTSGSTGKPKNVVMTHESAANMVAWQNTCLPGARRTLQFTSLSFDVSFQEMATTWAAGGALVLIDEDIRVDAEAMLRLIDRREVSRIFMPFVAVQNLAETAVEIGIYPNSLRQIITAGEQLRITPAIIQVMKALEDATLHNHYGPTETHAVTYHDLGGDAAGWPLLPPVGRPVYHARVYLLGAALRPVPQGVPGELYVAGGGLARGYGARPGLTAERYLPNPFASQSGERLYRTGDLARYDNEGNILFLGRADFQVKIRGYRVELGEVEAAVAEVDAVTHVIVGVRTDNTGNKLLVAYLTVDPAASSMGAELQAQLRARLETRLPKYMVPTVFLILHDFPLTPGGKVDRKALGKLELTLHHEEEAFIPPTTPTEEMIAAVFAEVLGLERVSSRANFFDLGGHSLMATRVVTRIREKLGVEISLRELFGGPTVTALASLIDRNRKHGGSASRIEPKPPGKPGVLSYTQQRLWFLDQLMGANHTFNLTQSLHVRGSLAPAALDAALLELARRHEVVRTVFPPADGKPVPTLLPSETLALQVIDLTGLPNRDAALDEVLDHERTRPFDMARGPLMRTLLIQMEAAHAVLVITQHHIITDGWSMKLFVEELTALYAAHVTGMPVPLAEPTLQYSDFAWWQTHTLAASIEEQLNWWREKLGGTLPVMNLQPDFRPPEVGDNLAEVCRTRLPVALVTRLEVAARENGATLFMVMLAAFKLLLHRLTGDEDLIIGTPVAGRVRRELEPLMGCFINLLPFRTRITGNPTFKELLADVRESTLDAFANQDVPFDRLVEELQPERSLNRHPIYDVGFNLTNVPETEATAQPGINLEPMFGGAKIAERLLSLIADQDHNGLSLRLLYVASWFSRVRMETMLGQYVTLLEQIADTVEHPVTDYSLIDTESRALLPDPAAPLPEPTYPAILERLAYHAETRPESPALTTGDRTWTYEQLLDRVEALARTL